MTGRWPEWVDETKTSRWSREVFVSRFGKARVRAKRLTGFEEGREWN